MKLMAVLALACGLTAAPMVAAAPPRPAGDVRRRGLCAVCGSQYRAHRPVRVPIPVSRSAWTRTGNTFVCAATEQWVPVAPLVGVRTMRAPCDGKVPGTAQSPAGQLLICDGQAWTAYNDVLYYG